MRLAARRVVLAVLAVLAVVITVVPAQRAAADDCFENPKPDGLGGKRVVILVHGWTGNALDSTKQLLDDDRLNPAEWATVTFSYPESNAQWPDKSTAAACLRSYIQWVDQASNMAEANVYLVGHSMGGLLSRFALDPEKDPTIRTVVAGVVTLDTPHLGSPLGSSAWAEGFQTVKGLSGDGAQCLALHHPGSLPAGCSFAPYVPQEIPVAQIAGNVTLKRVFFSFGFHDLDLNGDGIVWSPSQIGYEQSMDKPQANQQVSAHRVDCAVPAIGLGSLVGADWLLFDALAAETIRRGDSGLKWNLLAVAMGGAVAVTATCGHIRVTGDAAAADAVAEALKLMPTRQPRWTIEPDGVGPIKVGATLSSLPVSIQEDISREGFCPPKYTSPDGWSMSIVLTEYDGEVMSTFAVGYGGGEDQGTRAPTTEAGITLGSSQADVLAAYPDAVLTPESKRMFDSNYADYRVNLGDVPLAIGTDSGIVDTILLGFNVVPYELCG